MTAQLAEIAREGFVLALLLAAPLLVAALIAGVITGLVAAFTQIQDPAVSLVPRVAAVGIAIALFAPAIAHQLQAFAGKLWPLVVAAGSPGDGMTVAVLALRGIAAIAVLTTLVAGMPRIAQAGLAIGFGLWSALLVAPAHATFVSVAFAAHELAIGAALGVVAAVPLLAAAAAGRIVDDVAGGRGHGPYARLFGVLAAAVFVGINGHVAVVSAIAESHRSLIAVDDARPSVLAALAALAPLAIRLATPWLVTAAVVELAIGAAIRIAGRAGAHLPAATAVPAALVMMTASLVATLAIAMAAIIQGAL